MGVGRVQSGRPYGRENTVDWSLLQLHEHQTGERLYVNGNQAGHKPT